MPRTKSNNSSTNNSSTNNKSRKDESHNRNGNNPNHQTVSAEPVSADGLIQQAEELKHTLRDALEKTGTLITALKRQKKNAKTMQSALASLRQLESLNA